MEFFRKSIFNDLAILPHASVAVGKCKLSLDKTWHKSFLDSSSATPERFVFRQGCEPRNKYLGARPLIGKSATPCFAHANAGWKQCPLGLNRSQLRKNKLWRLCLQNLSNGCSTHTGTILKWDGSRFYRENLGKKSARPTLYTRALNGHSLEFAAENIHRTCQLIDDIEKSAPERKIAAKQTVAPIRLKQHFRIVRPGAKAPHFPYL
jgi:hypothetical protein